MTTRQSSKKRGGGATSAQKQAQELAQFINDLDGRALLYMYALMEDRPLEALKALQIDQLRLTLAMRTEIDVRAWREKTTDFMAGPANEVDWTAFAGLQASNRGGAGTSDGVPDLSSPGGGSLNVNGVPATPSEQGS